MTQETNLGSTSLPLQDSMDADMWPSGTLSDLNSSQYDAYTQNCFMPDHLSWPDDLSALSGQYGIDLNSLRSISQPHQFRSYNYDCILRHQGRSILSQPGSPPNVLAEDQLEPTPNISTPNIASRWHISEEHRQSMQQAINKVSEFTLPPRNTLSRYIQRYFKSFHRHQPFLHDATWLPSEAAHPLVLAVCANGALYNLERKIAISFHQTAVAMMKSEDEGLWALQTMMLLIAFAAWSGEIEDLRLALRLQARVTINLRQEWASFVFKSESAIANWRKWLEHESMKRFALSSVRGLEADDLLGPHTAYLR